MLNTIQHHQKIPCDAPEWAFAPQGEIQFKDLKLATFWNQRDDLWVASVRVSRMAELSADFDSVIPLPGCFNSFKPAAPIPEPEQPEETEVTRKTVTKQHPNNRRAYKKKKKP